MAIDIPILIICYNNHLYVRSMVDQLIEYTNNIVILDNCSTWDETIKYLKNENRAKIIKFNKNYGHTVYQKCHIINDYYIVTDPDLELNKNLPSNFLEILIEISEKYNAAKVGFALDISDSELFYQQKYYADRTILEWEKQFWTNSIPNENFDLYLADIDTTFALYNKKYSNGPKIRIAGNFTAKHLPWYVKNNDQFSPEEIHFMYAKSNISTTTGKLILEDKK